MTSAPGTRRTLPLLVVLALLAAVLAALPAAPARASVPAACGSAAQNGLTVAATHGAAFYVDLKSSPKLDASYIGYRVTNGPTARKDLWVSLDGFSGSSLSLANPRDAQQQVPVLSSGATKTAYFLLKASAEATSAQSHVVRVWQGDPSTTQASPLYSCTFTFSKVQATIKAAANKVTSVTSSVSGTPQLGGSLTVTVTGNTGTIGNGSTPDNDIIWLSPTAFSSWPTRALRLEAVSLAIPQKNSSCGSVTYVDRLLIPDAKNCHSPATYTATYTFTVIGRTTAPVKVAPVAQIASGTQYKHTDIGGSASATLDLTNVQVPVSVTKTVTETDANPIAGSSVTGLQTGTSYGLVSYRIRATTTTPTAGLALGALVDVPQDGIVYKTGSATVSAVGRFTEALAPSTRTSAPGKKFFTGPLVLTHDVPVQLDYKAYVPLVAGSHLNHAYAVIGDEQVGANPSTLSGVVVTAANGAFTWAASTVGMDPSALTQAPTRVGKTTVTLAGLVDANGVSTDVSFRWGATAGGVAGGSYSVVTAAPASTSAVDAVPVTASLSGLTASTTYYYRVVAGTGLTTALGDVLSFTTSDPTSLEISTTSLPDGLVATPYSAQLAYSGTVSTTVRWSVIRGSLPGGLSLNLTTGALTGTPTTPGSGTVTVEVANGNTADDCTTGCATASASAELTLLVRSSLEAPVPTTKAANQIVDTSAQLNGDVLTGGGSVTAVFIWAANSALTSPTVLSASPSPLAADGAVTAAVTGLLPGTTYWFRLRATSSAGTADGTVLSLTTAAAAVAPVATTLPASAVGAGTATLLGTVQTGGGSTTLGFVYGTQPNLAGAGSAAADPGVRSTDGPTAAVVVGLLPLTTYYYRLEAGNAAGPHSGSILSFTTTPTPPEPPQVQTGAASEVGAGSAVLEVLLTSSGGASTALQVEWGTSSTLATAELAVTSPLSLSVPGAAAATLTGLAPSITYYYRAVASGPGGTAYGEIRSFTTDAASVSVPPTFPVVPSPVTTNLPVAPPPPPGATESGSDTSATPDGVATAVVGPLAASASGMGGITVGRVQQPTPEPAPGAGENSYFTVDVDAANEFERVGLRLTEPTAAALFWWDGSSWNKLPGTVRDGDTLVVVIDGATRPGLADLPGLQLAYGATAAARLAGADRQSTAIAASRAGFSADGSARSVVLARSDVFADALTGGPLAVREHGPVLLSDSASLSPDVAAELQRVLGSSGSVYLLGQEQALAPAVADAVRALGYRVVRLGGADRYSTAVTIARALGNPQVVFEATGLDFADAVAAGSAAVAAGGAVLLTAGTAPSPATTRYLAGRSTTRYAVGGHASAADSTATPLVGQDRYDTAALVAERFFPKPSGVGIAVGSDFPDPLVATPYLARRGHPILLVSGTLSSSTASYLQGRSTGIGSITVVGGTAAVTDSTVRAVQRALP